jgi:multidrug efflux pump
MVRHQGRQVIALGVSMAKGGDIIAWARQLQAAVHAVQAELPVGIELEQMQDQPQAVSRSVGEFVRVLIEAVVIVLAVSFISLGLHFQAAAHRHLAGAGGGASRSRWCWRSPS